MKSAFDVGLIEEDPDDDYFATIEKRTQYRQDVSSGKIIPGITTGIPELDKCLNHRGWGRRELSGWFGGAKASKSFMLGFNAGKAVAAGYNTLFITLENSKNIAAARLDALYSGVGLLNEQWTNPVSMEMAVKSIAATSGIGQFKICEAPAYVFSPADLRRMLDSYRTKGITFDLIVIDYLGIMAPDVRTNDHLENRKSVVVGLREVAKDENAAILTAAQLNREGHKSVVGKAEHVAEDFNIVRTLDLAISINRTDDEAREGKARLTFAATRNAPSGYTLFITQELDKGLAIKKVESVE